LALKLKAMKRDLSIPKISFKPTFDMDAFWDLCDRYEMEKIKQRAQSFQLL